MEAASSVVYELAGAVGGGAGASGPSSGPGSVSTFDVADFQRSLGNGAGTTDGASAASGSQAAGPSSIEASSGSLRSMLDPLVRLNDQASRVQGEAFERIASQGEFSVSEMLELSVEVHKFSFQSQLTSNIADKSSRGIQQLFRQKA